MDELFQINHLSSISEWVLYIYLYLAHNSIKRKTATINIFNPRKRYYYPTRIKFEFYVSKKIKK